jgi:hypothetical protein
VVATCPCLHSKVSKWSVLFSAWRSMPTRLISSPHSKQVMVGAFVSECSTNIQLGGRLQAASSDVRALPSQAIEYGFPLCDGKFTAREASVPIKILVTEDVLQESLP